MEFQDLKNVSTDNYIDVVNLVLKLIEQDKEWFRFVIQYKKEINDLKI
jgi:hypothetical protein